MTAIGNRPPNGIWKAPSPVTVLTNPSLTLRAPARGVQAFSSRRLPAGVERTGEKNSPVRRIALDPGPVLAVRFRPDAIYAQPGETPIRRL